jgi:hypothetical protein
MIPRPPGVAEAGSAEAEAGPEPAEAGPEPEAAMRTGVPAVGVVVDVGASTCCFFVGSWRRLPWRVLVSSWSSSRGEPVLGCRLIAN